MCVAGGKRCEYSDALSNVRRKVKNKMKNHHQSAINDAIEKAIWTFQAQNPELMKAHLPVTAPFQVIPPKKPVPASLRDYLSTPGDIIIRPGTQDIGEFHDNLHKRHLQWENNMTKDGRSALISYTMADYIDINSALRRRKYSPGKKIEHPANRDERLQQYVSQRIELIDASFDAVTPEKEPERLYRFYRVPNGIKPGEYIKKYFAPGAGFKDKGYLSTTLDPEYVASHVMSRSKGTRNKNYIVFEILSGAGGSLQQESGRDNVQAVESELLLPRNTGLRIVGSGSRRFEMGSDRNDLAARYAMFGDGRPEWFKKGAGLALPVVQMIDEKLIRSTGA